MSKPNDPFQFAPPPRTPVPVEGVKTSNRVAAPTAHGSPPVVGSSPATRRGLGAPAEGGPGGGEQQPTELLSARTVDVVRWSWGKVMPISDAAAALFYQRLFELDPSVRPLFKADITEQKKKLMLTLGVAVDGLTNLNKLVPVLQGLGARHRGYMVADHHYDLVGSALLWTLREGLGDDYTAEVEAAWTQVYGIIANVMKDAAKADVQPVVHHPPKVDVRAALKEAPYSEFRPTAAVAKEQPGGATRGVPAKKLTGAPPPPPRTVPPARPAAMHGVPIVSATMTAEAERTLVGVTPAWHGAAAPKASLDVRTIKLVQQSWAQVMPISDAAAALFYQRLFELDPSVRPLFKADITEQKKKLMLTLGVAVDGLTNLSKLVPVLEALGVRHQGYMVAPHHYDIVGAALLWTLQEGLGDGYTSEVEAAWKEVYGLIADVMKNAAAAAQLGPKGGVRDAIPSQYPMQDATQTARPRASTGGFEDDAMTLHHLDRSDGDETVPGMAHLSEPPSSSGWDHPFPVGPVGANPSSRRRGDPRRPNAVPAEATNVRGILIPTSDQPMVVNVHVKMDNPPFARPFEPRVPEPALQGGVMVGLLVALLCIASSLGTALVFTAGAGAKADSSTSVSTVGAPLVILIIVFGAFALGHMLGRRPGNGREGGGRG